MTPTPVAPAIGIGLSSPTVSVGQGQTASLTVNVTRTNFTGSVDVTVETLPAGVTATVASPSLSAGVTSTSVAIAAAKTAAVGSFTVAVRAHGAGVTDAVATLPLTIAGLPSNLSLSFCASDFPIWVATQDNQGDWVRALPDGDNVFRVIIGARGAVAAVYDGTDLEVIYGTLSELTTYYQSCRSDTPQGSKNVFGTTAGFTTGVANISLGTALTTVFVPGGSFNLTRVADGPLDLLGVTKGPIDSPNIAAAKVIVRRNQNIANNGVIPVLDFGGQGAAAAATGRLSISNLSSGSASVDVEFRTTTGASAATYYMADGGAVHTYLGVPSSLTAPGDLHAISVDDATGDRFATIFARDVADRSLVLGPSIGTPSLSLLPGAGPTRWTSQFPRQSEYNTYAAALFVENTPSASHAAAIIVTGAYVGSTTSPTWDIAMPDLTPAGFNASWGMRSTAKPGWIVTAAGSTSLAQFFSPTDGTTLLGSSRFSDDAGQTQLTRAAAPRRQRLVPFAMSRRAKREASPANPM